MSDQVVVMNQGYIQQMGTPEQIYNEPENAFVADFIGDSNILPGIMLQDQSGARFWNTDFACVDEGFGTNRPVDVVIRPEDIDVWVRREPERLDGVVTHLIFKGVHYEMEVLAGGFEWLVQSTTVLAGRYESQSWQWIRSTSRSCTSRNPRMRRLWSVDA